jgi:hypothetical protein
LDLFPVAETRFIFALGDHLRVIAVSVPTRTLSILVRLNPEADEDVASRVKRLQDSIQIDPS